MTAAYFSAGFVLGAMAASVLVVVLMSALTVNKISDLQERIDELEGSR